MKVIIAGSRSIDRMSARRWDYDKLVSRIDKAVVTETEKTANFSGAGTARRERTIPTSVLTFLAT